MRFALAVGMLAACGTAPSAAGSQLSRHGTSPVFLEAMTLQLTRQMQLPGAKPHMMELLRDGEGAPRIREVSQMFPAEVEALVASGEWEPSDLKEWKWLALSALNQEHYPSYPVSLAKAMELSNSPARYIAAGLLYDGSDRLKEIIAEGFKHPDANNRAYTALAVSIHAPSAWVGELTTLADDPDPWARGNALAALVRLGHEDAPALAMPVVDAAPSDPNYGVIPYFAEALERAAPGRSVENYALFAQGVLVEEESTALRAGMIAVYVLHREDLSPFSRDVAYLRRSVSSIKPLQPELQRCIHALAKLGTTEDLEILAALAVRKGAEMVDLKADLQLATALAAAGHPVAEELLRTATWTLPWNQSVLAAGCAIQAYGADVVVGWAAAPPEAAAPEAIHRLGWSLGRFHGPEGVHLLRNTSGIRPEAVQGALLGATYRPE